jgi:hypothetical protein
MVSEYVSASMDQASALVEALYSYPSLAVRSQSHTVRLLLEDLTSTEDKHLRLLVIAASSLSVYITGGGTL